MTNTFYEKKFYDVIPREYEELLSRGISDNAFEAKELPPMAPVSIIFKDEQDKCVGGVTGTIFYGSLYVDTLWVDKSVRRIGLGSRILSEMEKVGRSNGAKFVTLNTMDWEALPFYQKQGYSIEFTREGYSKDSKMYMLRKNL